MRPNLWKAFQGFLTKLVPRPPAPTATWAEEYLRLPRETSDITGSFSMNYTPHLYGIFAALDDPEVEEVVCMKAAQVAWTTALLAYLLKMIDTAACPIIGMFSTEGAAREFNDEKLMPTVRVTPVIREKIDTSLSSRSGSRALYKQFTGGFLKLIGSNAIRSVKASPAKIVFVEEPDDSSENLNSQGNSIVLLWERTKRKRDGMRILGGTPAVKGLSRVEKHLKASDMRVLPIECHECGHAEVLDFNHVTWIESDSGVPDEVFGRALPETAAYACPNCACTWDDYQRKENIRNTVAKARAANDPFCGWVATKPFKGIAGFHRLGELYSCLGGAGVESLCRDYLKAKHSQSMGDENDMIVFINSKRGEAYEYGESTVQANDLGKFKQDYPELVCPAGGLLVTVGVDVQHDRLAIIIRAWGRGEESWLLYWGEISADTSCIDKNDQVWDDLDELIFRAFEHESGGRIYASAVSIDSSDGMTNAAVYSWVRSRSEAAKYKHVKIMAIKGASDKSDKEIFTTPSNKSIDHKNPSKTSKADKFGVKVYIVGTNKGKDWIYGQLGLVLKGKGRFHFYDAVRDDYADQMVSEVKAPHRSVKNRLVWQQKPGEPCEAWDCEDYALHAARAKRVHLMKPAAWDALEQKIKQSDLFSNQLIEPEGEEVKRSSMAELGERMKHG